MLPRIDFINVAYADIGTLVKRVNAVILNPLIVFMFAVAVVYFIYGVFEFLSNADSDDARTTGKTHMLWGVIGMFIMMAVFGIMQVIMNTLGVTGVSPRG
jgi:uncharacterized membrane protein YidH (DUF202 family)